VIYHNVIHQDDYEIVDIINSPFGSELIERKRKESPFVGLVRLYQNGELLKDTNSQEGWLTNMTIVSGREFAAQTIFKRKHANSLLPDITKWQISHFGIGSGGSSGDCTSGNLSLTGPKVCDTRLYSPHIINRNALTAYWPESDATVTGGGSITAISNLDKNDPNFPYRQVAKKIESCTGANATYTGSITVLPNTQTSYVGCNGLFYTVVKCECIVEPGEPIIDITMPAAKIDEAMLYCTDPTITGFHTIGGTVDYASPVPFAHICFYPKFITTDDVLTIQWYIIF
jgi:hypothetical protein